ncbi:MAG: hypothetical protein AAF664_01060 [Planctomycetota bacterium]
MLQRLFLIVFVAMTFLVSVVTESLGQAGTDLVVEVRGKLVRPDRAGIIVESEDGETIAVAYPPTVTSLSFEAAAKPEFLSRGMMVRFKGNFNQAGMAQGPIKTVEIFGPVDVKQLSSSQRERFTPGVHLDRKHKRSEPPPPIATVTVVGSFAGVQGNMMVVQAGKTLVRAPVNEETKVIVKFNSLELAKAGDPVYVKGFQNAGEKNVRASTIRIRPERVYGEKPPEEEKPKRKRRGEKSEDADEDGESDEGEEAKAAQEGNDS